MPVRLPVPRLVVFYNGTQEQPDEQILKLTDSFPEDKESDIEVRVRMLNVNYGRNRELLEACKPLGEYSWLVAEIRKNQETKDEKGVSSAIDKAITAMPDDFVIKPFLEAHRVEVKGMLLTEYNEAEAMELFKKEGLEEGVELGREEGIELGTLRTLMYFMKMNRLTVEEAAEIAGMSVTEFQKKMDDWNHENAE